MKQQVECAIYKSVDKIDYYLYVDAEEGLDRVPDELKGQLGELEMTFSFTLTPQRTLAREDPMLVLSNLQAQGYHLQLPPAHEKFRG